MPEEDAQKSVTTVGRFPRGGSSGEQTGRRLARWERRAEWPLAAVAIAFLAIYSFQVLAQPSGTLAGALSFAVTASWLAFVIDYAVRLFLAPRRVRWLVRHLFDLAIVLLPLLRPLRLLRLVVLVGALQRAAGTAIRGRVIVYTAGSAVLFIYVASLAILETERTRPGASITSFGNAVWWSLTTVTTVGYGDYAPVTTTGRFIAAALMLGGVSLIGMVTATLASWIVERVAQEDATNQLATSQQIEGLMSELISLREKLDKQSEILDGRPPQSG